MFLFLRAHAWDLLYVNMFDTHHQTYKRGEERGHPIHQLPSDKPTHSHSQNNLLLLKTSMDSFRSLFSINAIFSEPETAPETSTPIDADGGSSGGCIVA